MARDGTPRSPPVVRGRRRPRQRAGRARARTARCAPLGTVGTLRELGGSRRPRWLEHVDRAVAAAHIDAVALAVDEDIVGIAAGLDLRHDVPVAARQRHQSRRVAKHDENAMRVGDRSPSGNSSACRRSAAMAVAPLARSTMSISRASGTLTKTRLPVSSIWKLSGWPSAGISAVLTRVVGSIDRDARHCHSRPAPGGGAHRSAHCRHRRRARCGRAGRDRRPAAPAPSRRRHSRHRRCR